MGDNHHVVQSEVNHVARRHGRGIKERGRELWKTDGTEAGTVMVKDINPGRGSSNPASLVVWDNAIYFTAKGNPQNPRERGLWKTDGTEGGTVPVQGVSYFPVTKAKAQPPIWPLAWPIVFRDNLYTAVNPYGWFGVVRARPGAKGLEIVCGPPIVSVSWPTAYGNPRWVLCDDGVVFVAAGEALALPERNAAETVDNEHLQTGRHGCTIGAPQTSTTGWLRG